MYWRLVAVIVGLMFPLWVSHAQESDTTRTVSLKTDSNDIALDVPLAWVKALGTPANTLDIRSSLNLPIGVGEWQRVRVEVSPLEAPFGNLPPDDAVGQYMEILQSTLEVSSEYPPDFQSEVARFEWGGVPAAVFAVYSQGGAGLPAYYARWFGLTLPGGEVLVIEQGMTLPLGVTPDPVQVRRFDAMLESLSLNAETLGGEAPQRALTRLTDPVTLAEPVASSLRLNNGLEVRLAAPQGWQRRDVTENASYPTTFFFEDDLRLIPEGGTLSGAVFQISLISPNRLRQLLELDELPEGELGDLAIAYLNALLPAANEAISFDEPISLAWDDQTYGVLLTVGYPTGEALHLEGTSQQLLVLEVEQGLILLNFYLPTGRWSSLLPVWQNMLRSLTINGESMPLQPLDDLVSRLSDG